VQTFKGVALYDPSPPAVRPRAPGAGPALAGLWRGGDWRGGDAMKRLLIALGMLAMIALAGNSGANQTVFYDSFTDVSNTALENHVSDLDSLSLTWDSEAIEKIDETNHAWSSPGLDSSYSTTRLNFSGKVTYPIKYILSVYIPTQYQVHVPQMGMVLKIGPGSARLFAYLQYGANTSYWGYYNGSDWVFEEFPTLTIESNTTYTIMVEELGNTINFYCDSGTNLPSTLRSSQIVPTDSNFNYKLFSDGNGGVPTTFGWFDNLTIAAEPIAEGTATPTSTPTNTLTSSPTWSPTATRTFTPTDSPTASPTATPTDSCSPTASPTSSPSPTYSPTPTATPVVESLLYYNPFDGVTPNANEPPNNWTKTLWGSADSGSFACDAGTGLLTLNTSGPGGMRYEYDNGYSWETLSCRLDNFPGGYYSYYYIFFRVNAGRTDGVGFEIPIDMGSSSQISIRTIGTIVTWNYSVHKSYIPSGRDELWFCVYNTSDGHVRLVAYVNAFLVMDATSANPITDRFLSGTMEVFLYRTWAYSGSMRVDDLKVWNGVLVPPTFTATPSATASATPTPTGTPTPTPTWTQTSTPTWTPTITATWTPTATATVMPGTNFGDIPTTADIRYDTTSKATRFGGQFVSNIYAIPDSVGNSPAISVNFNNGNVQYVTLKHTGKATISLSNGIAGGRYLIILKQDTDGNHVVDMTISGLNWKNGTEPTQTLTANKKDIIGLIYNGSEYLASLAVNY